MFVYRFTKIVIRFAMSLLFRIRIYGRENIPESGAAIVCSNHISVLDPVIMGPLIKRKVHYMAKEELFNNPFLRWYFPKMGTFPVKRGATDVMAIKTAMNILKQGNVFGIFIEGTRSRSGEARDPKHGTALLAIKTKAPVIPVKIQGEFKPFSKITINIGKPIYLDNWFGKKVTNDELTQISLMIMNEIDSLISE